MAGSDMNDKEMVSVMARTDTIIQALILAYEDAENEDKKRFKSVLLRLRQMDPDGFNYAAKALTRIRIPVTEEVSLRLIQKGTLREILGK